MYSMQECMALEYSMQEWLVLYLKYSMQEWLVLYIENEPLLHAIH